MGRRISLLLLFFTACSISLSSSSALSSDELSLVVAPFTSLQISPSLRVEKSPGVKPGIVVLCARVQIHGLSRLRNLTKFAHSVKVNVSLVDSSVRPQNVEVCFHRNLSIGIGMCPQGQWEKLVKGSWVRSMSPFDHKLLDVRMAGSSSGIIQVFRAVIEPSRVEFLAARLGSLEIWSARAWFRNELLKMGLELGSQFIFLARARLMNLEIHAGTKWRKGKTWCCTYVGFSPLDFCNFSMWDSLKPCWEPLLCIYLLGTLLCIYLLGTSPLHLLGMKLLPTGRKNSVAIFVYSSVVGLGSFFLRYLPGLLRSVLVDLGISDDMYYPLATFLLLFLVLAGAWLGFWVVRKLVLTEDGLIDIGVSHFVAWSIRIIAAVMILQSTVDPLLAAEALLCGILVSSLLRRITRSRFIRHLYKKLRRTDKSKSRYQIPDSSTLEDYYDENVHTIQKPDDSEFLKPQSRPFRMAVHKSPVQGLTKTPRPSQPSDSGAYYSSFHSTPERRKFSKDEWDKFTKDSTKKALEELVSSPDFSKWAVANAERITLSPNEDTAVRRRSWLPWFWHLTGF